VKQKKSAGGIGSAGDVLMRVSRSPEHAPSTNPSNLLRAVANRSEMREREENCSEDGRQGRCCENGSQWRGGGRRGQTSGDANKMRVVGMRLNHSKSEATQAMAGGGR
jgi:hypothetical protein